MENDWETLRRCGKQVEISDIDIVHFLVHFFCIGNYQNSILSFISDFFSEIFP